MRPPCPQKRGISWPGNHFTTDARKEIFLDAPFQRNYCFQGGGTPVQPPSKLLDKRANGARVCCLVQVTHAPAIRQHSTLYGAAGDINIYRRAHSDHRTNDAQQAAGAPADESALRISLARDCVLGERASNCCSNGYRTHDRSGDGVRGK